MSRPSVQSGPAPTLGTTARDSVRRDIDAALTRPASRSNSPGELQGDLFGSDPLAFDTSSLAVRDADLLFVIGCGRSKRSVAATADRLYTSPRFRSSIALAQARQVDFVVLSGKHGIVDASAWLEPYDLDLVSLDAECRRSWALAALAALRSRAGHRKIVLLAGRAYAAELTRNNALSPCPLDIVAPWEGLQESDIPLWLAEAERLTTRARDAERLYDWIDARRLRGEVFPFRDLSTRQVPARGVYLFLDPREPNFRGRDPRIVRIGTHAVSAGSKSTLRSRLRNHLGPASEVGSHRGSIFRLHVGRAMLELGSDTRGIDSWGIGQDAPNAVKLLEREHEIAVSRYLQGLEVLLIEIGDEPGKSSLRALLEMQLIALCSEGLAPLDRPTSSWLGNASPTPSIRRSGLWNIRGVGGRYRSDAPGSVTSIIAGSERSLDA